MKDKQSTKEAIVAKPLSHSSGLIKDKPVKRPKNLAGFVEQKAKNHSFKIASKDKVSQWMKSNQ